MRDEDVAGSTEFDDFLGGPEPIQVELNAYVLPSDHGVWKCFPGQTYRFLETVKEAKAVFLDVRGLDALPEKPADWPTEDALKIIADDRWARELEKKERGLQTRGSAGIGSQDRKVLTFLRGLLIDAKKGDLIVLPADGYRREVLIGQLLDDSGVVQKQQAKDRDGDYTYIARRVKWLPSKEKRKFKAETLGILHSTSAFHIIREDVRSEIYEAAYGNFIKDDTFVATFETTKQQFTTADNAIVSVWFNALAVAYSASVGDAVAPLANKSFGDLGLLKSAEAERGELSIDIASPGSVLLHSAGVFALAAMTLFPMMELEAAEIVKAPVVVKLHTVGSADASCSLKIAAAAHGIAQTLSVTRLQEACMVGRRAREEATLKTDARLKSGH